MRNDYELTVPTSTPISQTPKEPMWGAEDLNSEDSYSSACSLGLFQWENYLDVNEFQKIKDFVSEQFTRFSYPEPTSGIFKTIWDTAIDLLNYDDSPIVYSEVLDIQEVNSPRYFQYALVNEGVYIELQRNSGELFVKATYDKGRWDYLYNNPGLNEFDYFYEDYLEEYFNETFELVQDSSCFSRFYQDRNFDPYTMLHLGVWACMLWILTPQASTWRRQNPIFDCCYEYGECLYIGSNLEIPGRYVKLNRPTGSCAFCNSKTGCEEKIDINEHLVRNDLPYYRYMLNPNATKRIVADKIVPGSYYICKNCEVSLVYPTPFCSKTGCPNTSCRHHMVQRRMKSRHLLV